MKVLFLDAYFEPEQIAFSHLEKDLLNGLVSSGHEVDIICPIPSRGIDKQTEKKYKKIKSEDLYDNKVHVTRFWAPHEGKNIIIRAIRYFWCNLRTLHIGKKKKGIDVVFSNSTPPTQGLIAGKIAKKHRVPFVYSLQDIFPDSLVNAGVTKKQSYLFKIGRFIENKTYSQAEKIITISDNFKNNIIEKKVNANKIVVIPNWIDTEVVFPVNRNKNNLFDKYNLDRRDFYICYSGNIGHSQNLDLLINTAEKLQMSYSDIKFVIIGNGAYKDYLEKEINKRQLNNTFMLPFQPYKDIANVFSLGDVGLVISKPGIGGSSVPSKTWSILAAEKPVLASFDENSELYKLVNDIKCGIAVKAGDEEALVKAIIYLYENKKVIQNFSKQGREYVLNNLSKQKCVTAYISNICGRKI